MCEPWRNKLDPKTGYDARFSLPFAVALMLARGKAGVAEFSEESFSDSVIRRLMTKVRYQAEPKYEVKDMPGWIEVTLEDGSRHSWEIPAVRGDARNPVALDELLEKFHANTGFLGRDEGSRIAGEILALDSSRDVRGFMERLLAPAAAASAA